MMVFLTENEKKVYNYICSVLSSDGFPPSVRDIGDSLGFSSTSTVHLYLSRLEEKGLIKRESGKSRAISLVDPSVIEGIPVIVRSPVGDNIFSDENIEGYIDCYSLFRAKYKRNELFALTVVGESMADVGILDGDKVIIHRTNEISSTDIAAVVIDGSTEIATICREGDDHILQPKNEAMAKVTKNDLTILGRVIACIRNY